MKRCKWISLLSIACAFTSVAAANESFLVDIRNAPTTDAIRFLAKAQGINIIVPEKLPGRVNANFPNVQMSNAMTAILDSNQLGSTMEGGVVKITTKKSIEDLGGDLRIVNYVLKFAKADRIAPQVKFLLTPRGTVMFDQRTNSVTVKEAESVMGSIASFIEQIDHPDRQVLIEARIVEASCNYLEQIGIQWGLTGSGPTYTVGGVSALKQLDTGRRPMIGAPAPSANAGVGFSINPFSNFFIDAQITAAEQKGDLSILSRPSIVTTNNQPATIHSGVKFYVKTAASLSIANGAAGGGGSAPSAPAGGGGAAGGGGGGATSGVQEITSGITLLVTPQITADNKIILTVNVTESQADFGHAVDGIPSIIDNNATTTVLLENASTTVIGGLFQKNKAHEREGVPFLQRLPIIGYLFGSRSVTDIKKELIIFLRPTIVADGEKPIMQNDADKRYKEIVAGTNET
jgi:type IV pilus assembly protein PilQ